MVLVDMSTPGMKRVKIGWGPAGFRFRWKGIKLAARHRDWRCMWYALVSCDALFGTIKGGSYTKGQTFKVQ